MKRLHAASLVGVLVASLPGVTLGAEQCVYDSGTYGAVTVTRSGGCTTFPNLWGGLTGWAMSSGDESCTFSFSPSVVTSTVRVQLANVDSDESNAFVVNGSSYTLVAGDVDNVTTPPEGASDLTISANAVTGAALDGAGTVTFTNSPPASTSTLEIVHTGGPTTLARVCFDDQPVLLPSITQIDPASGTLAGGTTVVITGTNLTGATAVTFGGVAAASFTVDSATQITAVTPAHVAGAVDVAVTTPGGSDTSSGGYTYVDPPALPPAITSLSPVSGAVSGNTPVVITGSNFTGATAVTFDDVAAASFTVDSATQITAVTPAHAAGAVDVVVTTSAGSDISAGGYTYSAAIAGSSIPTLSEWALFLLILLMLSAGWYGWTRQTRA
jgi:hypothetical protein